MDCSNMNQRRYGCNGNCGCRGPQMIQPDRDCSCGEPPTIIPDCPVIEPRREARPAAGCGCMEGGGLTTNRPMPMPNQSCSCSAGRPACPAKKPSCNSGMPNRPMPSCGAVMPNCPAPSPSCGAVPDCPVPLPSCGAVTPDCPVPLPSCEAVMPGGTMSTPCNTVMPSQARCDCPDTSVGGMEMYPTGMGYVPWQQWQQTYSLERGFSRGTIFPELDLPFVMGRCR